MQPRAAEHHWTHVARNTDRGPSSAPRRLGYMRCAGLVYGKKECQKDNSSNCLVFPPSLVPLTLKIVQWSHNPHNPTRKEQNPLCLFYSVHRPAKASNPLLPLFPQLIKCRRTELPGQQSEPSKWIPRRDCTHRTKRQTFGGTGTPPPGFTSGFTNAHTHAQHKKMRTHAHTRMRMSSHKEALRRGCDVDAVFLHNLPTHSLNCPPRPPFPPSFSPS